MSLQRRRIGKSRTAPLLLVGVLVVAEALFIKRRGYGLGGNVVVRCSAGHLFTTIWIPGGSLKAIRLGGARFQRCPVGNHWSLVRPVAKADLTAEELRAAEEIHDVRIP